MDLCRAGSDLARFDTGDLGLAHVAEVGQVGDGEAMLLAPVG